MQDSNKKIGRPTKYDPAMCQMLIDGMSKGFSIEACAGKIGVSKETVYQWVKEHPEFSDAKKTGEALSRDFWESLGIDHILNKSYSSREGGESKSLNAAVWCFNMKNRFGWRDKQEVIQGQVESVKLAYNLDDEEENKEETKADL